MEYILKELKRLERKCSIGNRELAAIGRIEHVEKIQEMLELQGMQLSAVLDNDAGKEGLMVKGVKIHKPEKFLSPFNSNVFILIYSPKYWQDMSDQFQRMGYREGEHFAVLGKPDIKSSVTDVWKGSRIYHKICRQYGPDAEILVIRGPVGDFYLLSLYLAAYLEKENIINYVLAGDSKGFARLADLFEIKNIYPLSGEETDHLIQAYIFAGAAEYRVHLLTVWQNLSFNSCLVKFREGFSFMDTIRAFSYGLPRDARMTSPAFARMNDGLETFCVQKGIKKGKTVILSPFAYSIQSLPMHFWQQLTDELGNRGYTVCVNIDVKKEKCALENVVPVSFTFSQSVAVLEYAGYLVGIRSGFIDVTSSAKCKKIILYPQYIKEHATSQCHRMDMEFCGLANMGLCKDAIEKEYLLMDMEGNTYMKDGLYDCIREQELIAFIVEQIREQEIIND